MTTRDEIDQLAKAVAEKALANHDSLEQMIEALKALTAYRAVVQKDRRNNDDATDGPDFSQFRADIAEAENGRRTKPRVLAGQRGRTDDN